MDSDYGAFSEKWLGTPNLNSNYLDNFTGNPPFTDKNNVFIPSTPGAGKTQTILDMINNMNDNSSDEDVETDEEFESTEVQEYAQDPNDVETDQESESSEEEDSEYDPEEDLEEGGFVLRR